MINVYCSPLKDTFSSLAYYGILDNGDAQCFRVNATVEAASWILVAASVILCLVNHFIAGAASQKRLDDDVPAQRRFLSDRWLHKQSTVTAGIDTSMDVTQDEEQGSTDTDVPVTSSNITPVRPRFTDYFFFATILGEGHQSSNFEAETAVLQIEETKSEE